jgi:hypothetical protein
MDYQQFTSIQHAYGRPGGVFVAFSRCHCRHGPFSFSRSADRKTILEGYKNGEKILSMFWVFLLFLMLLYRLFWHHFLHIYIPFFVILLCKLVWKVSPRLTRCARSTTILFRSSQRQLILLYLNTYIYTFFIYLFINSFTNV